MLVLIIQNHLKILFSGIKFFVQKNLKNNGEKIKELSCKYLCKIFIFLKKYQHSNSNGVIFS